MTRPANITSLVMEPANDGAMGYSFEIDPTNFEYEYAFATNVGRTLIEGNYQALSIVDFGCGNGLKALGLIQAVRATGYAGSITYDGLDIDQKGLEGAEVSVNQQVDLIDRHALHHISMLDFTDLENLLKQTKDLEGMHLLLFQDSLHWLQPEDVSIVLALASKYSPPGTYVSASCCSVWNTTSIGAIDCLRQDDNIKRIEELLNNDSLNPLGRKATELEYQTDMSHFTPTSMSHVFERAGFTVLDCRWRDNPIFPNGRENLSENVDLIAIKRE